VDTSQPQNILPFKSDEKYWRERLRNDPQLLQRLLNDPLTQALLRRPPEERRQALENAKELLKVYLENKENPEKRRKALGAKLRELRRRRERQESNLTSPSE